MMHRLRQIFSRPTRVPPTPPVFALAEGCRIYAVGDIHGRAELLKSMLAAIVTHARAHPVPTITEIFLGDYIDRGLDSRAVLDCLIAPPENGHQRICLRGNHEQTLLDFLSNPALLREWTNFGGFATLASYGITIPTHMSPWIPGSLRDALQRKLPPEHLAFLRNLPLHHQQGDYLFVHAGIDPHTPLNAQKPQHLLWIRDRFLNHDQPFNHYIVHGHSPVAAPDIRPNRANLDISEAATPSLCCLIIEGTRRETLIVTAENH